MKALAEFAMRGGKESILVALICMSLPLLFVVGAAIVGLTILRKGISQGAVVFCWATIPASGWMIMASDPTPLLVVAGTATLATILRSSVSWVSTLIASLAIGFVCGFALQWLAPEAIRELIDASGQMIASMNIEQLDQLNQAQIDLFLEQLVISMTAAAHVVFILMSLMLARYWQSNLYNPGGFQQEFHQLRIPSMMALALVIVVLLGGSISPAISGWIPLITVPFALAGLALIHGLVHIKGMGRSWIVVIYLLLIVIMPYMYLMLVLIAIIDSMVDFRSKIVPPTLSE
ncbi:MAG: hypothetical protein KUG72_00745 [Pseudomonadales bacterium]|nr:hypothetical protein [Pseudomonadales bacterium]